MQGKQRLAQFFIFFFVSFRAALYKARMAHVSLKTELFNPDWGLRRLKKTFNFYAVGGEELHTDSIYALHGGSIAKVRRHHGDGRTDLIFEKSEILSCGVRYSDTCVAFMRDGRRDKPIETFLADPVMEIVKRRQHFSVHARPDLGIYRDILPGQRQFLEFQLDSEEANREDRGQILKDIMRGFGIPERSFVVQPYHLLLRQP